MLGDEVERGDEELVDIEPERIEDLDVPDSEGAQIRGAGGFYQQRAAPGVPGGGEQQ